MAINDPFIPGVGWTVVQNASVPPPQNLDNGSILIARGAEVRWSNSIQANPTDVWLNCAAGSISVSELIELRDKLKGVCLEHDDCKASLLAHACKESQRQSEEKSK